MRLGRQLGERADSDVAGGEAVQGSGSSYSGSQDRFLWCSVVAGALAASSFPSFRDGALRVFGVNINGRAGSRGGGAVADGSSVHRRYISACLMLFAGVFDIDAATTLGETDGTALQHSACTSRIGDGLC